jgi:hypothetical protein
MRTKKNSNRILLGNPEGNSDWEDQDLSGWAIFSWMLNSLECYGLD